jgi:Protein kinase domain
VFNEVSRRDPGLLQRICGLQSLSHPGIERVFEVDEDSGALLLITESLSGVSLQQLIDQGGTRLTLPASQTIIQSVASALVHAHSHNVFHGDVRAENVFITDAGEVRLRGFELNARDMPANPKGDRLAFSWFAYELLSRRDGGGGNRDSRLREPPGVTREQWRALRLTMTGKEDTAGNVLTAFGGANNPGPVVLLRDGERARVRRMGTGGWIASGLVAAILVVAGYFILTTVVLNHPKADAQPAVASAPAPKADAQPIVASAPAPKADAQPVVAGAPVPAPGPQVAEVASANVAVDTVPVAPAPHVKAKPAVAAPRPSRALIDLPSATATVAGDQPVAKIWVRRRGGLTGEVSFLWWTESGSARVDQDFRAITPRTATINDGARGVELLVPLVANPARQQSRTFYVKIDEPGERASLGDQTLMQVSIVPPGYVQAPEQR